MKLKTGFTEYSDDELFHIATLLVLALTGSVVFTTLKPTPVEIEAATDAFEAAMNIVGPARKQAVKAARATLEGLLAEVAMNAPQIEGVTDADLATLHLPAVKTAVRTTPESPADTLDAPAETS